MSKSNSVKNEAIATEIVQTENEVTIKEISHKYEDLMIEHKTKSSVVRFLFSEGHNRSQIAKFMDIRYQHVRNILVTPLKKS